MKLSMPGGLFRKYLVFLLILVGGLLSVSSAVELYFSYQETKQSIVRLERTKALAAASEIERYLSQIVQHLRGTMQGAIDALAGASGLYRFADVDGTPELVVSGGTLVGVAFGPSGELVVASNDTAYLFERY